MLSTKSIAHVSTRRPWITVGAWIAVVVVAMGLIATMLGEELKTNAGLTSEPESIEAQRLIRERFATSGPRLAAGSLVMFQQMGFGLAVAVLLDADGGRRGLHLRLGGVPGRRKNRRRGESCAAASEQYGCQQSVEKGEDLTHFGGMFGARVAVFQQQTCSPL